MCAVWEVWVKCYGSLEERDGERKQGGVGGEREIENIWLLTKVIKNGSIWTKPLIKKKHLNVNNGA